MKMISRDGKQQKPLTGGQERIAGQLAAKILDWQRRAAEWLNSKTSGLSIRTWRVLLISFCLLFGAYCLWLLVQVF